MLEVPEHNTVDFECFEHIGSPVKARYEKQTGICTLTCAECGQTVAELLIAP